MSTWSIKSHTAGSTTSHDHFRILRRSIERSARRDADSKRERAGSAWILPFAVIAISAAGVVLVDLAYHSILPILNILNGN